MRRWLVTRARRLLAPGWYLVRFGGDWLVDRWLGTDTARHVSRDTPLIEQGVHRYEPSNWTTLLALRRLLSRRAISRADTFIDFGCGKGQVLLLVARYPFGRVIGLDVSPDLLAVARRNVAANTHRLSVPRVELVEIDAAEYEIPPDLTYGYFYNPFPVAVMEVVVGRIAGSVSRNPREVALISLRGEAREIYAGERIADVFARHGFHPVRRISQLVLYSNGPSGKSDGPGG